MLLTAELPYVDVRKCLDHLDYEFRPYVTGDKICAGSTDGKYFESIKKRTPLFVIS